MVKANIRCVLRLRPSDSFDESMFSVGSDKQTITLGKKPAEGGAVQRHGEQMSFKFDGVLQNATQDAVYDAAGAEAVEAVLQGYNSTIMAYGQTGAGKTYTMSGGKDSYKQRGLIPRAISALFHELASRPSTAGIVRVSYAELYNETIYDLLNPSKEPTEISLSEDAKGNILLKGLSSHVAATEEDALALLFEGECNRAVSEHQLNKASSRSHTIFTLSLELHSRSAPDDTVIASKLNMVDLAGSERLRKTRSEGAVAKEAQYINKSLSFLEQVILALTEKFRDHIPYRSSKLTHMLRDSLGGNCKTLMIANVWAAPEHLDETISTCKFAARIMRITNAVSVNLKEDPEAMVRRYEREIRELRLELAARDSGGGAAAAAAPFSPGPPGDRAGGAISEPYTETQRLVLRDKVREFLESDGGPTGESLAPLDIVGVRHAKESLLQARLLFRAVGAAPRILPVGGPPSEHMSSAQAAGGPADAVADEDGVGELEGGGAFAVGVAPSNARPAAAAPTIVHAPADPAAAAAAAAASAGGGGSRPVSAGRPPGAEHPGGLDDEAAASSPAPARPAYQPPPGQQEAFETFNAGPGAEAFGLLQANRESLKQRKEEARSLAQKINAIKREMDETKANIDRLKAQREEEAAAANAAAAAAAAAKKPAKGGKPGEAPVPVPVAPPTPEEEEGAARIKELKKAYREEFDHLKLVRSEADYTAGLVEQAVTQLGIQFSQWFQETYGQSVVEAFAAAEEEMARALNEAEFEAQEQAAEQNEAMARGMPGRGGDEDAFIAAQRVARKVSAPTIKRKGPKGTF